MWITPDRVFYVGLLGLPSVRTMGAVIAYVAASGTIDIRIDKGEWTTTEMGVVAPYVPHEVRSQSRLIHVLMLEAETVDLAALPPQLHGSGAVDAPEFVRLVRQCGLEVSRHGRALDLDPLDFDRLFFGAPLAPRKLDHRISSVIERIKSNPSDAAFAEDCAEMAHLSFSRFLHLFRQEVAAPFRSFRTWKRARSLLHYVHRSANLSHVALDAGYPDSSHFSHSIRQVYGLKPSDIFAGSRRLAVYGPQAMV